MELRQETTTTSSRGGSVYQVTSWVDSADTSPMPDAGVFLYQISGEAARTDRFLRVCTPGDMVQFPADRDVSVRRRLAFYRANSYAFAAESIQVAQARMSAIKDLVDQSCKLWSSYEAAFDSSTQPSGYFSYTLPNVAATQRQSLIDAYTAARDAQAQTEELVDAAAAQVTALTASQTSAQSTVTMLTTLQTSTTTTQSQLTTLTTSARTLTTQARSLLGVSTSAVTQYNTDYTVDPSNDTWDIMRDGGELDDANTAFGGQLTTWQSVVGTWAAASDALSSSLSAQTSALATANATLTSITAQLKTQTALRAQLLAQLAEQANTTLLAQQALVSYCPDIDVSTL